MRGDCLNTGCVPSKALLRSARFVADARRSHELGIRSAPVDFDFGEVMERVQRVIKTVEPHDSVERYTALGVEVIEGAARITSPYRVEVNGRTLTTRSIVIAAGARPLVPPIPGIEDVGYLSSSRRNTRTSSPAGTLPVPSSSGTPPPIRPGSLRSTPCSAVSRDSAPTSRLFRGRRSRIRRSHASASTRSSTPPTSIRRGLRPTRRRRANGAVPTPPSASFAGSRGTTPGNVEEARADGASPGVRRSPPLGPSDVQDPEPRCPCRRPNCPDSVMRKVTDRHESVRTLTRHRPIRNAKDAYREVTLDARDAAASATKRLSRHTPRAPGDPRSWSVITVTGAPRGKAAAAAGH